MSGCGNASASFKAATRNIWRNSERNPVMRIEAIDIIGAVAVLSVIAYRLIAGV